MPKPPDVVPIPEHGAGGSGGAGQVERELDKSFGYDRHFTAKYELGKEVGCGHFGHTCLVRGRKGDMRGQVLAVKVISKAKVLLLVISHSSFIERSYLFQSAQFLQWIMNQLCGGT